MPGINDTAVDALFSGGNSSVKVTETTKSKGSSTPIQNNLNKLIATGNSTDSIFASGEKAASNLTAAQINQVNADREQADVQQAYVKSSLNASQIENGLLQAQAARNANLDKSLGALVGQLDQVSAEVEGGVGGSGGFLDHLGGIFKKAKLRRDLEDLHTIQLAENQQTANTLNVMQSLNAGIDLKAKETSEAQRDATQQTAIATAQFQGYENTAKVKSDQIAIQTQILNKQMAASELAASSVRLNQANYQLTKLKDNDASKGQWVADFNKKFGTNYSVNAYDNMPDQYKVMIMQVGSGAQPIQNPNEMVGTLNTLGVTNDRIETAFPGTMQKASIANNAAQQVNQVNAAAGAKPTADQLKAQIDGEVKRQTMETDKTLLGLATDDGSSTTFANVPAQVKAVVQPILVQNMQTLQAQNSAAQFSTVAKKLAEADPNQTAKQLADKLVPLFDSMKNNMTKTLQSQGISNDGYGFQVDTTTKGFFTNGTKPLVITRPADVMSYAANLIEFNQNQTIKRGMLNSEALGKNSQPLIPGNSTTGVAYGSAYKAAMEQYSNSVNKLDTTK